MKLAEQYEKPEFITDDPVQFPRRFGYKCSQEIVGFIAAWLAYGNRKAILSTCEKLCKEMERLTPYMYIKNMGWRKYIDSEEPLYRFFKEKDFAEILNAITSCENENELRACMKLIQERFPVSFNSCFVYGFGSTHMWVTEPGRKERLIFVEF